MRRSFAMFAIALCPATAFLLRSTLVPLARSHGGHVAGIVISELMWAGSDLSTADEWIELTNTGSGAVDLGGWVLTKQSDGEEVDMLTLPDGAAVGSGRTFLIANYDEAGSRLGIEPDIVDTAVSLVNTQLLIRLYVPDGTGRTLVDAADDGVGAPFAGGNDDPKASMERIDLSGSGRIKTNWRTADATVNFDGGALLLGTPGAPNGSGDPPEAPAGDGDDTGEGARADEAAVRRAFFGILITEVLANPAGADDEEWIEIGNTGTGAIDVGGLTLDEGNSPGSFTIPSPLVLTAGERRAFRKSLTGLPLGNQGETLSLMTGSIVIDAWAYPETAEEVSYGRRADAPDTFQPFCVPTEGKPNDVVPPDPRIVVQSVSADTTVDGSGDLTGINRVTANLTVDVLTGSTTHATCRFDYGDGFTSDSCNPPSHTFRAKGTYAIRLRYGDVCGATVERAIGAIVGEQGHHRFESSCLPAPAGSVQISEFIPNPVGKDADNEWIEIMNPTKKNAPLCGFSIDDGEGGSPPFAPDGKEISAFGFLVLGREETGIALNNEGDAFRLFGPDATLLEEVVYGGSTEGWSYARTGSGTFLWTDTPTPGGENAFSGDSGEDPTPNNEEPGEYVEVEKEEYTMIVTFNEILSTPGRGSFPGEYIELVNLTGSGVSLAGWILDDNPTGSSRPYTFPDGKNGIPIYWNDILLLCNGTGCDLPLKVSLNNEGEELSLTSPDGTVSLSVTYPEMERGESYARRNGEWHVSLVPTPREDNIIRNARFASPQRHSQSRKTRKPENRKPANESVTTSVQSQPDPIPTLRKRYRHVFPTGPASPEPKPEPSPLLAALQPQMSAAALPPTLTMAGSVSKTTTRNIFGIFFLLILTATAVARRHVL